MFKILLLYIGKLSFNLFTFVVYAYVTYFYVKFVHTNLNVIFLQYRCNLHELSTGGADICIFSSQKMKAHFINPTLKSTRYLQIDETYTPASIVIILLVITFWLLWTLWRIDSVCRTWQLSQSIEGRKSILVGIFTSRKSLSSFYHWFVVCQIYEEERLGSGEET